jgi:hypothetical protein
MSGPSSRTASRWALPSTTRQADITAPPSGLSRPPDGAQYPMARTLVAMTSTNGMAGSSGRRTPTAGSIAFQACHSESLDCSMEAIRQPLAYSQ